MHTVFLVLVHQHTKRNSRCTKHHIAQQRSVHWSASQNDVQVYNKYVNVSSFNTQTISQQNV